MSSTRDQLMAAAGRNWTGAGARRAVLSPREAALVADRTGGPSVDELEQRIRAQRDLPTLDPSGPADTSPPTG